MIESKTVTFVRGVSGSEYISKISNDEYLIPRKELSNVSIIFDGTTLDVPERFVDSGAVSEDPIPGGIRRITYDNKRITVFKTNGTGREALSITYTYRDTGVYGFGELHDRVDVYSSKDVYNKDEVYDKTETDDKYRLKSDSYSKSEADAKYRPISDSYSKTDVLNKVFPVGSLYFSNSTGNNPADIIGGTWENEGAYMLTTDKTASYAIRVVVYRRKA